MSSLKTNPFGFAICATLAVLVCASRPYPSRADDPVVRTLLVSTKGVDLASPSGQAQLHHRIERAAQKVCGAFDAPLASLSNDYMACHDQAVADATRHAEVMIARASLPKPEMMAQTHP